MSEITVRGFFTTLIWLMALLLPPLGCAQLTYSAKAIQGRIVDADTGQPLEGVNIVARWSIDHMSVGDAKALLHVTETVTDANGNYSFPAWGPIVLPSLADFGQGRDPLLSIFKSGYEPEFLDNGVVSDIRFRRTPPGEFKWNGATTNLKKWQGSVRDYWWRVNSMSGALRQANDTWRRYPRMVLTLLNEERRLMELGAPGGLAGIPRGLTPEDEMYLKRYER